MKKETLVAIGPYFVWMALMFALDATAVNYAWRTGLTAVALAIGIFVNREVMRPWRLSFTRDGIINFVYGLAIGVIVCFLWIFPERFAAYRDFNIFSLFGSSSVATATNEPSPYSPEVCGWTLTWIRLIGSAFIIAPIEEFFYRSFVYRWLQKGEWTKVALSRFDRSAFLWMIFLFALEHHTRLAAGAMAGAFYGYLAIRRGIGSAVVAHVATNLLLGLYVIWTQEWGFW